jgi:hypothetical protein
LKLYADINLNYGTQLFITKCLLNVFHHIAVGLLKTTFFEAILTTVKNEIFISDFFYTRTYKVTRLGDCLLRAVFLKTEVAQ